MFQLLRRCKAAKRGRRGGRIGRSGGLPRLGRPGCARRWRLTLTRSRRRLHGSRTTLERPGVVHGRLEVRGVAHLHVHPDMIRKATNEELGPLTRGDVPGVTCHRLEAMGELLHSGNKRQAAQLSQPTPVDRRAEAQTTQLLEALPRWHALVLH